MAKKIRVNGEKRLKRRLDELKKKISEMEEDKKQWTKMLVAARNLLGLAEARHRFMRLRSKSWKNLVKKDRGIGAHESP